jgi:hypothetical protein
MTKISAISPAPSTNRIGDQRTCGDSRHGCQPRSAGSTRQTPNSARHSRSRHSRHHPRRTAGRRAVIVGLSRRQRAIRHGCPRPDGVHDSNIYAGHAVPETLGHAADRAKVWCRTGALRGAGVQSSQHPQPCRHRPGRQRTVQHARRADGRDGGVRGRGLRSGIAPPGGCVSARGARRGTAPSRWLGCARAR